MARPAGRVSCGPGEGQCDQPGGGDEFADQVPAAGPILVGQVLADVEHDVGQQRPANAADSGMLFWAGPAAL
jgi:hypothetical protein